MVAVDAGDVDLGVNLRELVECEGEGEEMKTLLFLRGKVIGAWDLKPNHSLG